MNGINKTPKLSVVMSVHNGEKFLKEAIVSILNQTFTDFEFIIIDDGSIDNSKKIIEDFDDKRIKLISRKNKGLTVSLNEGLNLARGEYIARMDTDDISHPRRFETQINFLDKNPKICLCGTWAKMIDKNGNEIGEYKTPVNSKEIRRGIFWHNPFIHSSIMIRRKTLNKVGGYNEKYKTAQDYELWSRLVPKYQTANLPEFLLKYRFLQTNITTTRKKSFLYKWLTLKIRLFVLWRLLM